jgi:hypothetical protein
MPVSYKRKNSMKKSKSSKGSKSSKLSKRVKTRKSTKTKKRLMRKSKNGSVVRKMRGGTDPDDVLRPTTNATNPSTLSSLPYDLIPNLITDLQSMLNLSQTNKQFHTLINKDLMHFINSSFDNFPVSEQNFITLMRTKMDRFETLNLAEIMLLFKYYNKPYFTTTFKKIYNSDDDNVFDNYLYFMKNKIYYLHINDIYRIHKTMSKKEFDELMENIDKLKRIGFNTHYLIFQICLYKFINENAIKDAIYFKKIYNVKDVIIHALIYENNNLELLNDIKKESRENQIQILKNITQIYNYKTLDYDNISFVISEAFNYINKKNNNKNTMYSEKDFSNQISEVFSNYHSVYSNYNY